MAKAAKPVVLAAEHIPLEKAHGLRRSWRELGEFDEGSARSIGPRRAARVWSPTRDVASRRVHIRSVS